MPLPGCRGVVNRDPARRGKPGAQHVALLRSESVEMVADQSHHLTLRDINADTRQQRRQAFRRHLALNVAGQDEATQVRSPTADDPRRQRGYDRLARRRHPALAAIADRGGLSDHTMGCGAAIAAVAHGAVLIEKHFTLRRADGGVDAAFSLEPDEFRTLRVETERGWQSLGRICYGTQDAEQGSRVFRRSLYISKDVKAGTPLSPENVRIIRPGFGLPPKFYDTLMGRRLNRDATIGTPLSWNMIG